MRIFRNKNKSSRQKLEISCPVITHGATIKDRKSSFQGHAAEVHSIDDINAVLATLMQNRKIHDATHNVLAYRIENVEGCDDDGEAHAGARLLRLLQILDQRNTLVVVSRWFGGIQLGPDRFRHINEAAKQALGKAGLLNK
ncbi:hypothetical protein O0L34_g13337 [Tuta absoluta]|nr:hypothetical protein O0L34_g13337 [Tuta absoluta]